QPQLRETDQAPRQMQPDDRKLAPTSVPDFSGERAFKLLTKQTSFGPRDPNSLGHEKCLNYLIAELRNSADDVRLQHFTHPGYDGKLLRLTNIIATFNPDASARILLCAHWDSRPRADWDEDLDRRNEPILGANDGASGVAVLLELASLMKEQSPRVGVDIVLFDGEDYGLEGDLKNYLLGSRYFAENKRADYVPRFGLVLDLIGDKLLEIPREETSEKYAPDIVDLVWGKARELGYYQFVDEIGEAVTDDHIPLNEVGIKTIDLIDFNYPDQTNRYWHTHQDTPDKCSAESLEAVGTVVTHVVYTQLP
ncbi:MAG: M28 family peptidase, partial [Ignavibacteria bacterium]|nr:M28 family peptidase [Ignavibacteria bacterium]